MKTRVAALAAPLLVALTACTTTVQPPAPTPVWTTAPGVPHALPTQDVLDDPCNAISETQRRQLGYAFPGEQGVYGSGPNCNWYLDAGTGQDTPDTLTVTVDSYETHTLTQTYLDRPHDAYFVPLTVAGYPAVFADHIDARANGDCLLWVSVTDKLRALVQTAFPTGPRHTDPCPSAKTLAEAVIRHLQGVA